METNAFETLFRTLVDVEPITASIAPTLGVELDTKAWASFGLGSRWATHDYVGEILPSDVPVDFSSLVIVQIW